MSQEVFKLFAVRPLADVCQERLRSVRQEIKAESADYLLNANESDLLDYYLAKLRFDPIIINPDEKFVTDREASVSADRFPSEFQVTYGASYRKHVITYHVPFSGDEVLLKLQSNSHSGYTVHVSIGDGTLDFDIVNFYDKPESVARSADSALKKIKDLCDGSKADVEKWNQAVVKDVQVAIQQRKAEHLARANLLAALNVPLKRANNVPATFSVPAVKKRIVPVKPGATTAAFVPEPTLSEKDYEDILRMIHEVGVVMESHPSIYQDKREEALRDHFIMTLSPHYDAVTGETFNKEGKSDILIRHEGKNIFVAECKFWGGKIEFFKTIDQLFQYVTWRDTKTAILLFVENQELTGVLDTIAMETGSHLCYSRDCGKRSDGWFMYDFHLPSDHSRHVKVALMVFHFPKIQKQLRGSKPKKRN